MKFIVQPTFNLKKKRKKKRKCIQNLTLLNEWLAEWLRARNAFQLIIEINSNRIWLFAHVCFRYFSKSNEREEKTEHNFRNRCADHISEQCHIVFSIIY